MTPTTGSLRCGAEWMMPHEAPARLTSRLPPASAAYPGTAERARAQGTPLLNPTAFPKSTSCLDLKTAEPCLI